MTAAAVVVREPAETGSAIALRPSLGLIRPIAKPADVLVAQEETRDMVTQILQDGRDFGVIPGTDKPTMLKPGAERVALAFGCYYGEPEIVEREANHDRVVEYVKRKKVWRNQFQGDREFTWDEVHGTSYGLYRYVVRVPVINRQTGEVVGSGIGSCSTMESKYIDRPRDSENTALKMAHKRALVGACLVTFGLSDQFTQDVEDLPKDAVQGEGAPQLEKMDPPCPKCGGKMWDNRLSKKKPTHPDFKCKKGKDCDGVIWPPREGEQRPDPTAAAASSAASSSATPAAHATTRATSPSSEPLPDCPVCQGQMFDNRTTKTNPRAPDFQCKNTSCEGKLWPGQWPPKPAATDEQRARIKALIAEGGELLPKRTLTALEKKVVDPNLKAWRADEIIAGTQKQIAEEKDRKPTATVSTDYNEDLGF